MFDLFNREESFDRKLKQLEKDNQILDEKFQALLDEFDLTEEKLHFYLSKREHFSEEEWETLNAERKKMEIALLQELRKKASTHTKDVQRHWIHAR